MGVEEATVSEAEPERRGDESRGRSASPDSLGGLEAALTDKVSQQSSSGKDSARAKGKVRRHRKGSDSGRGDGAKHESPKSAPRNNAAEAQKERRILAVFAMTGPVIDVEIRGRRTVGDAKREIQARLFIPVTEQMLIVGSNVLSDNEQLARAAEEGHDGDINDRSIPARLVRVYHSHIYACGGRSGIRITASVERFSPAANLWSPTPPMRFRRDHLAAATVHNCVYVMGGYGDNECAMNYMERYDPTFDSWEIMAPMRRRRADFAAVGLGNHIYATGGFGDDDEPLASCERYDCVTKEWLHLPPMRRPRHGHAAVVVNGCIVVIGGRFGTQLISEPEKFDPASGKWTTLPDIPVEATGLGAVQVGGRVYALGGRKGGGARKDVAMCDVLGKTGWSPLAPMCVDRGEVAAATLGGQVYALGGHNEGGATSTVEWYDTAMERWISLAPMREARRGLAVTCAAAPRPL